MAATRRWLTPSRALCLETHQIRPYPQPSPRACTHVASAPKWTYLHGKDRRPHAPAVAGGAAGRHSPPFTGKFATGQEKGAPCRSVRRCALQPPPRWTAVPRLVLPRARPAHLGSPLGSRSRPWHAPVLGVAWALGAAHTAPHCSTLVARITGFVFLTWGRRGDGRGGRVDRGWSPRDTCVCLCDSTDTATGT
jgi:hypothetical protein